jgi:hypothetical protein
MLRLNHAARFWSRTGANPIAHGQDYMNGPSALYRVDGQIFCLFAFLPFCLFAFLPKGQKKIPALFRARGFVFSASYATVTPRSCPVCSVARISAGLSWCQFEPRYVANSRSIPTEEDRLGPHRNDCDFGRLTSVLEVTEVSLLVG